MEGRKYNIVQVVGDSSATGAPRHVILLGTELQRRGHEVVVIAPPGKIIRELKKRGIKSEVVKMGSPLDRKADHKIREIIEKINPDVVHCHGTKGGWLGRLATRKLKSVAVVYTEHLWTPDFHLSNPVWEQFQLYGLKYLDKHTDYTIAVSNIVKKFLVKEKITPSGKIFVIPNMLDPHFTSARKYEKPPELPLVVGSVGSLNIQKGYFYLIEAMARIKARNKKLNYRLQIIGSGPLEKPIKKHIKKYKMSREISLISGVDDVRENMRHFSLYVQNSRSESFGMAALEAMALRIPIIVTDRGALPEIVENGKNGIVVPYGKVKILSKAIEKILLDAGLREKLGENARKSVLIKYNPVDVTRRIEIVYDKAINRRRFVG